MYFIYVAEVLTLRELNKEGMFSLFHEERSPSGSTVLQGTVEVSLCLLPSITPGVRGQWLCHLCSRALRMWVAS